MRWTAATLWAVLALNALVAGILFLVDPEGGLLGMDRDVLARGPFVDFFVPGAALALLGAAASVAAGLVAQGRRGAGATSVLVALAFLAFVSVQWFVVGAFWLQAVVVGVAAAAAALAVVPWGAPGTRPRRGRAA